MVHFASAYLWWYAAAFLIAAIVYRIFAYKEVTYRYSLASFFAKQSRGQGYYAYITLLLRSLCFFLLFLIIGQPQLPDVATKLPVEGIDIMLVLDLSASMAAVDDPSDGRRRVDIAKTEAKHFAQKRSQDALGLVVFGANALARCPLTHDYKTLATIVDQLEIGNTVIPDGTVLSVGLMTALNRLKDSDAASKVIVLLTDGSPTQQDLPIDIPLQLAKQLGVKIYTIGIGETEIQYGFQALLTAPLNADLLEKIAQETGGQSFIAKQAQELKQIYDTIDRLERRPMEVSVYQNYRDISWLFVAATALCIIADIAWRFVGGVLL